MFKNVMLAYGGIDAVIVTAGVFVPPDKTGYIEDQHVGLHLRDQRQRCLYRRGRSQQDLQEAGSAGQHRSDDKRERSGCEERKPAYDTSKAAANHLVRELAIEMSPLVRVNAVAPATVVKGSTMFPRDRVIASLAKYDIAFNDDESTEELRDKLADFYAKRSLTQSPIEPEDQAEAIFLLLSNGFEDDRTHYSG